MTAKHIDPSPDNFQNYKDAAEFWDTRDTTDYLDEFKTVKLNSQLRARYFEVEVDENVIKVLQAQAKEKGVRLDDLASELLRQQLGMVA